MSTTARDETCSASSESSNSVRVRSPNVVPRLFKMAVALSRRGDERRVLPRGGGGGGGGRGTTDQTHTLAVTLASTCTASGRAPRE